MNPCVESALDPEIAVHSGGNALPEPSEATQVEVETSREHAENEPRATPGKLARWFGFRKSRAGKIPNIVHVNLESFFASVEQVMNPKLRKKPVLVGNGIVAAASYGARLCGVKPGMTVPSALLACPTAMIVSGDYDLYGDFAERVRQILESYTPAVETGNNHDFYLDFAASKRLDADYLSTLRRMQCEVLGRTGLSVSIGAGQSKVVAATASGLQLPSGIQVIMPGEEEAFLAPLPVGKIHGIGPLHGATVVELGISTCGELRKAPKQALQAVFGEMVGQQIWGRARGLDGMKLSERRRPGSISRETSIEGGGHDKDFFAGLIQYLGARVGSALREDRKRAYAVGFQARYADGFSAYESMRIDPTSDERKILVAANRLFAQQGTRNVPVTLIGITAKYVDGCERPREPESKDAILQWRPNGDSVGETYGWNVSEAFG